MALQIRSGKKTKFINKLITIPALMLALVAQPMYALVASQVASAVQGTNTALQDAIDAAPVGGTVDVTGLITTTSEIRINKSITLNGNGNTIEANHTGTVGDNDNVIVITGGPVTINNLVVDGKNMSGVQGIQVHNGATATLNNVTARNNAKAGIHVNGGSTVTVNNVTTANNGSSYAGVLVSSGSLAITGQSQHSGEFSQVRRNGGSVSDAHNQYSSFTLFGVTVYTLRSAPAAPTITSPTESESITSPTGEVTITWNAVSGAHSYLVAIDGAAPNPVVGGTAFTTTLSEGVHTVTVQAVAQSGLTGGTSLVRGFTVVLPDTTAPSFAITNPVNGSYVRGTQTINAEITDESDIAKVLMNIAGSSRSWTNGSSSTITRTGDIFSTTIDTTTIADGPVHVVLRGTDGAGNTRYWNNNASNRQHVFYVDNTRPVVELVSPVGTSYNPVNYEVKATDNLALQTVTAHIYNAANTTLVKNCSNTVTPDGADEYNLVCPVSSLGLANGMYTIRYNAADKAGNTALTKTATFTIDTTKPTIHVKGQGNAYAPTSLGQGNVFREVSFKLFDGGKVDRVEINGVNKNLTDSTWSDVNNIKPGVAGAVEGKNTLVVFDVAGNSTTYEFVLDTTAPKITVKPGYIGTLGDKIFSNVSFALEDYGSSAINKLDKYTINGHLSDFSNNKWSDANFQNIKAHLVEGENTLVLYDEAGNLSSYTFTYDATKPTVKVNLNRSGYLVSDGVTNSASKPEIEAFDKHLTRIEVWKNGEKVKEWTNVAQNTTTYKGISWLGNGTYVIRAFDAAGLVSDDFTVTIDNTAPAATFSYSNNNGNALTRDDVTVTMTTNEPIETPADWTRVTDTQFTRVYSANGKKYVTITDLVGNSSAALVHEVKRIDRNAPTISGVTDGEVIEGPATLSVFDPKYEGYDGFDQNTGLVINGSSVPTTEGPGKTYFYTLTNEGTYTVVATDKAGNETTVTFTIESEATETPEFAPIAIDTANGTSVSGTAEPGETVVVLIYSNSELTDDVTSGVGIVSVDGAWTAVFDPAVTTSGTYYAQACYDGTGSECVTQEFTVTGDSEEPEIVTPSIAITSQFRNLDGTWTISGTSDNADRVQVWVLNALNMGPELDVTLDESGNWTVTTGVLTAGTYWIEVVAWHGETSVNAADTFTVSVIGEGSFAELPVFTTTDDDDDDTEADSFIAFLPATFGGIDLNDGAVTSPIVATPAANNSGDAEVLGAEDTRADWSVVNAALAGFIAILAVVALAGIRRGQADNNTGARIFTLVPAAAAVIAFFVIEGVSGSMIWFNVWTWLFAGILVVQAILATLTTRTAND